MLNLQQQKVYLAKAFVKTVYNINYDSVLSIAV